MAVQSITFFKVPFDNTYKNVYTFSEVNSPNSQYVYNKFRATFDYIDYIISNKEFRITNNRMVISYYTTSRNGAAYYNINQYNYCAVQSNTTGESVWRFYFITGYSTLNQSPTNGSIELQVEYDCWLNNISKIINNNKFISSKGHVTDVNFFGDKVEPKNLSFTSNNLTYTFSTVNPTRRNVILWARILLTDNELYEETSDPNLTYTEIVVNSCSSGNLQLPYVYLPVAVYNLLSKEYYPAKTYELVVKNGVNPNTVFYIGCFNMQFNKTGIISTVDFTFCPPFNYYEDGETQLNRFIIDYEEFGVKASAPLTKVNDEYAAVASVRYGIGSGNSYIISARNQIFNPKLLYKVEEIDISGVPSSKYISGNDVIKYQYPFRYYDVEINGSHTQIVLPENTHSFQVVTKILNDSVVWYVECFDQNKNEIYQTKEIPIYNNGTVPHINDPESLFFRNQGNQFLVQADINDMKYINKAVQSSFSIATGTVMLGAGVPSGGKSLTSGASGFADATVDYFAQNKMFEAKRADLANMTNEISIGSANALESIFLQNAVIINKYEAVQNAEYNNLMYDIYRYGLQINHTDYTAYLPRKIFNFKKAENFEAPQITNNQERLVVQAILNSGVTIWNFAATSDSDAEKTAKNTMMPNDIPNPCI